MCLPMIYQWFCERVPGSRHGLASAPGRPSELRMSAAKGVGMKLVSDAAREAAESVMESYWKPGLFPVDPDTIARRMGISVTKASLPEDTSGFIRKVSGQDAQIFLEAADSSQRQRFTCAHELGHYVERTQVQEKPDDDFGFVDKRTPATDIHEYFANEFAGNLLAPRSEVDRLTKQGWDAIRLAAHFGLSLAAMKTRMLKYGLLA